MNRPFCSVAGLESPEASATIFARLESVLEKRNGGKPDGFGFAPGRLNLIGEHVDYCGGWVMPAAISLGTYAVARILPEPVVVVESLNEGERRTFPLESTPFSAGDGWLAFPKGVFRLLRERDPQTFSPQAGKGLEIVVEGNLPAGAGLSSSASFVVLLTSLAQAAFGFRFCAGDEDNRKALVRFAQSVENDYIGLQCGVMDQAAVVFGRKDRFILLDCETLSAEPVLFPSDKAVLIFADTRKTRQLADSKYNRRRLETDRALEILQTRFDVNRLCQIRREDRERALEMLEGEEILRRRVRHVIDENGRVLRAKEALKAGDTRLLGEILVEGHRSLSEDYECTGKAPDAMFQAALNQPDVLGARITGGGFGGSVLILLRKNPSSDVLRTIADEYRKATGLVPAFHPCVASAGVSVAAEKRRLVLP